MIQNKNYQHNNLIKYVLKKLFKPIAKSHITTEKYAYNMTMTFNNFLKGDEGNYTCSAKKSDATKETQSAILAVLCNFYANT